MRYLITVPSVQTWLVQRVTNYMSGQLKTKVTIGKVDIKLFNRVILKDLYIEDQQHDTLLFAPNFEASINRISISKHLLTIQTIELQRARIGLKIYKKTRDYNYDFIIDYFSSSGNDTSTTKPWAVTVHNIILQNNTLSYRDLMYDDKTPCINWDDVYVTHLNVNLKDFETRGDSVNFIAKHISLHEKSGFELKDFSSKVMMKEHRMRYEAMRAVTDNSEIHGNIIFNYDSLDDFNDFIAKVKWESSFSKSVVSFRDLKYFAEELIGLKQNVTFSGDAKGTVDRFKVKNLDINYTPTAYFKGDVSMTGLPKFEETYMELDVKDLSVTKKDIETIPAWPFDSSKALVLPPNLATLGVVHFTGKFNGFYNDFVAYGNTTTALGYLSSDINLKIGDNDLNTSYSGNLSLFDFDMGKLWKINPDVGLVSMKAHLIGKGLELVNVQANLEGDVSKLQLYNYDYSNIKLNGHLAKKMFTGDVAINDPNLDMDFEGEIDLHEAIPVYNFTSTIRNAKLSVLHLINRDTSSTLSADVNINMNGNTIDNLKGTVQVDDLLYHESGKDIHVENLFLESKIDARRELNFNSDVADAQIVGSYTLSDFITSAKYIVSQYLPAITDHCDKPPLNQNFNFHVNTKKTDDVTAVFLPWLTIASGTIVEGNMMTNTNELSVLVKSDKVGVEPAIFSGINIKGNTYNDALLFNAIVSELKINDSLKFDDVHLSGTTKKDTSNILLTVHGDDSTKSSASVRFDTKFLETGYTIIKTTPVNLLLEGNHWNLDPANYILLDNTGLLFQDFKLTSGIQMLDVKGIMSNDSSAKFVVKMKDFEVAQLNTILQIYDINVGGVANGKAEFSGILGKPLLNADLDIKQLRWFNDTVGDAIVSSKWNSTENIVDVNATVTRGGDKNISVVGKYILKDPEDELDFKISLQKTYIQTFSHYFDGIFSHLSGVASADLDLKGTANNPLLTGKAHLQKVGFMVDYLKTMYTFSADVDLDKDAFVFKDIVVNDIKGNQGTANGKITHDHLRDYYLDFNIKANNSQVLNTTAADNDLFYGVAYATGGIRIWGYLDYIYMNIGLKSERGTKISIPLTSPEEVSQSNFITIIRDDSTKTAATKPISNVDFSGVELNMNFDITKDANISLIFDSKIGDIIEGNGKGNLTMSVSPTENFKMFGSYEIDEGNYLFTMQNLINKKFTIDKGGYVRWNGDPYDAIVKIDANYQRTANLYDLFQDSSFKKRVPVDLKLHLSEKLFNPNISFDINVLNVDPTIQTQIKNLIKTEDEKYRQAVAFLVTNRFTTPAELRDNSPIVKGNAVSENAYEMLSNQLSNWASQISNQVNVGVNYRPGDILNKQELDVALSTNILNDRVAIDGNFGYVNSTGQNTSSLIGDFNVEVKASKDGRIRLKAFNRSNNNSLINNLNSPYTQGIGVFYREEFNSFNDLTRKFREFFKHKNTESNIKTL